MSFELNTVDSETKLLLDTNSSVDDIRAQRIFRMARVAVGTWLFFAGFCLLRGYLDAALTCVAEVSLISWSIWVHRNDHNYRRLMNVVLGLCAVGLLSVSCDDPALSHSMLFYSAAILIASQLSGIRDAFIWLIVCLVANGVYVLITNRWFGGSAIDIDELILMCGVNVCVFFCCQQAEVLYRLRTQDLIDASDQLRDKATQLQELATTDSLTGLSNRLHFQKELENRVRTASSDKPLGLVIIDMDGFKEINDTLGHPIGDQALVGVADRLRDAFDEEAIISRLGGDEFSLILPGVKSLDDATEVARRAYDVLSHRYEVEECKFPLYASLGVAIAPEHTSSATELLSFADTAMFYAKDNRLGCTYYESVMTDSMVRNRDMREWLTTALEREEFHLVYQPQVSVSQGRIIGVEALLRWQHNGEYISPVEFIPLLEHSRGIVAVGRWVLQEACRQLSVWNQQGLNLGMSVNLSSVQLRGSDLCSDVVGLIDEYNLDPAQLDFEITESLLIEDVSATVKSLSQLKSVGVSISIDDFGTGYSSLAYLRQFPIDRLKIDRAFVKDIPLADDGMIATSIIALSRALNLKVLAEGVETDTQLEFLKSLDCDEYQGYYYSRPVPGEKITQLVLSDRNASTESMV